MKRRVERLAIGRRVGRVEGMSSCGVRQRSPRERRRRLVREDAARDPHELAQVLGQPFRELGVAVEHGAGSSAFISFPCSAK